jgi:hypothetical protein
MINRFDDRTMSSVNKSLLLLLWPQHQLAWEIRQRLGCCCCCYCQLRLYVRRCRRKQKMIDEELINRMKNRAYCIHRRCLSVDLLEQDRVC